MAKKTVKKTAKKSATSATTRLMASGAEVPSVEVAAAAIAGDLDVTDTDEAELGTYIKTNVRSGLTCVLYPAGDRVMMSVH